ncbi:hypothetical protein KC361_g181 [Hortaea werneckii]|nr:hypothetical protein KC361_g181 [Hortaea werneckii]
MNELGFSVTRQKIGAPGRAVMPRALSISRAEVPCGRSSVALSSPGNPTTHPPASSAAICGGLSGSLNMISTGRGQDGTSKRITFNSCLPQPETLAIR